MESAEHISNIIALVASLLLMASLVGGTIMLFVLTRYNSDDD